MKRTWQSRNFEEKQQSKNDLYFFKKKEVRRKGAFVWFCFSLQPQIPLLPTTTWHLPFASKNSLRNVLSSKRNSWDR
jgi:hypothetical protein